ncbi:tesmin/TSO1-like CXC [Seminavis robusta]|uniref:Tesmin/TSO1-like CXC n=1 Tax=Seminavis robusta TaxID=568900 RepID=A0A9N8F3G5_9STRA|nr:tesmin/TSO1-like CXC [Seminavis robusta]|eukprot:Sro3109_g343930.1 tesmin/TSO1-like CXC (583) ;mRNA; f:6613-8450
MNIDQDDTFNNSKEDLHQTQGYKQNETEPKPWITGTAAASRSNESNAQVSTTDYSLGILKETKSSNLRSIDSRQSISWQGQDKQSAPWTQTANYNTFESKPLSLASSSSLFEPPYPMPPPLKKRLSTGFALGIGLSGWSSSAASGGALDDTRANSTADKVTFNTNSMEHRTPAPRPRSFSIGSRTSLSSNPVTWTVGKHGPLMSDPLMDTPCPKLYYGNLNQQTPLADPGFGGAGFGSIASNTWNQMETLRRGSLPGKTNVGTPFAFGKNTDYMPSFPPAFMPQNQSTQILKSEAPQEEASDYTNALLDEAMPLLKRERPSEFTNVMLDGRLVKIRRVNDTAGVRANGNVPQFESYVTVEVDQNQLGMAQTNTMNVPYYPTLDTFSSLGNVQTSKPTMSTAGFLSSNVGSMNYRPAVSFDTLSQSSDSSPPVQGCICKRSRCLKLYCKCFQTSNFCDRDLCRCKDCHNTQEYDGPKGERRIAMKTIKARRPNAFETRPTKKTGEGCSCKKNRCLKKYCDCFANGVICIDEKCTCKSCGNGRRDSGGSRDATNISDTGGTQSSTVPVLVQPLKKEETLHQKND